MKMGLLQSSLQQSRIFVLFTHIEAYFSKKLAGSGAKPLSIYSLSTQKPLSIIHQKRLNCIYTAYVGLASMLKEVFKLGISVVGSA